MKRSALGILSSPPDSRVYGISTTDSQGACPGPSRACSCSAEKVYKIPWIIVHIINIFLNIKFFLNDFKIHNFKERKQLPKCFKQNLHGQNSQRVSEKSHCLFIFNISPNFPITANPFLCGRVTASESITILKTVGREDPI